MKAYIWVGDEGAGRRIGTGIHNGTITVVAPSVDEARVLARTELEKVLYGDTKGDHAAVDGEPWNVIDLPAVVDFDSGECC